MADIVLTNVADGIATVTMNRPGARNALSLELIDALAEAIEAVERDATVRALILAGAGKAFCAGMDLGEIGKLRGGKPDNEWMERVMKEPAVIFGAWLKTYRPTKPIILAAEGFARAGGTEILQGTDIRVAGKSAMFGVTEVQRGLFPMAGSAVRLRRQIGYAVAAEMLLAGEDLPAMRAFTLGLVNHVVPDAELERTVLEMAEQIAGNSPAAIAASKEVIDIATSTKDAGRREFEHNVALRQSEDHIARFRAAAERVVHDERSSDA